MSGLTLQAQVHFKPVRHGRRRMTNGEAPATITQTGRIPRISRLMALAIRFDGLMRSGAVRDYAELARLGHVTRARVTQIMNLLNLAPDIQEALLFLPLTECGRDPVKEWEVRPVAAHTEWSKQQTMWRKLLSSDAT